MPEYNINSLKVYFPFNAYSCQQQLMQKLVTSLQTQSNALLESPTGTGKTLCLLCAALAWREAYLARQQLEYYMRDNVPETFHKTLLDDLNAAVTRNPEKEDYSRPAPIIYYASRTHSQLSQAINELKKSDYRHNFLDCYRIPFPRMCILGSREQMCINPLVTKVSSNAARTALCRDKVKKNQCQYIKGVEAVKILPEFDGEILDIEDLVAFGSRKVACPYYLSKENQNTAEIIFLPYNYLIDGNSRNAQKLDLDNAILIFDEAHNLESSCSDATSFEISAEDLRICITECKFCVDVAISPLYVNDIKEEDFKLLKEILEKLLKELNILEIPTSNDEFSKPGEWIYELFGRAHITLATFDHIRNMMEAGVDILMKDVSDKKRNSRCSMHHILSCFKIMFTEALGHHEDDNAPNTRYYRVHISNGKTQFSQEPIKNQAQPTKHQGLDPKYILYRILNELKFQFASCILHRQRDSLPFLFLGRILSFWCFSPGLVMKDLVNANCRSIILASGTLAPLPSFAAEFQIDFKVQLEGSHVISSEQTFIGVLKNGPCGIHLNSSFYTRNSTSYQKELGRTIVNFSKIVPDGLIVFFPSYSNMRECIETWKHKTAEQTKLPTIWDEISHNKEPVVEPTNKQEFARTMATYNKKISENNSGSIFFAVCRGKVSEGIDFSDAKGRAVVITGIPFPPYRDPKVVLKRSYLDEIRLQSRNRSQVLSGDEWYKQQAARAVNQALGRVIRHRKDYGAILLCDERFASPAYIDQLSIWVRPLVKVFDDFGHLHGGLWKFFQEMSLTMSDVSIGVSNKNEEVCISEKVTLRSNSLKLASSEETRKSQRIEYDFNTVSMSEKPLLRIRKQEQSFCKINASSTSLGRKKPENLRKTLNVDSQEYLNVTTEQLTQSRVVKRNTLGMLLDKQKNSTKPQESLSNLTKYPKHDGATNLEQVAKVQDAKGYLIKVKKIVGKDGYREFQEILTSYREKTLEIEQLIERLRNLFMNHDENLILEFQAFIPSKHIVIFEKLISEKRLQRLEKSMKNQKERENVMEIHFSNVLYLSPFFYGNITIGKPSEFINYRIVGNVIWEFVTCVFELKWLVLVTPKFQIINYDVDRGK
ncbi:hypothetical protein G9A89_012074 [Geosiphon pyriformis]|nr:hypothetical protein G9A89_012074 [Geosiphon pyriformis]